MERIPEFQQDVSTVLIALHFPKATGGYIAKTLEMPYTCPPERPNLRSLGRDCVRFRCTGCGEQPACGELWDITLDPFSLGMTKWCSDCAFSSIKAHLKRIASGWPVRAPGSDGAGGGGSDCYSRTGT